MQKASYGAAQTVVAAIADRHVRRLLPSPCNHASVKRALGGFKRVTADAPVQQAEPLTYKILERAVKLLQREEGRRDFVMWRTVWRMTI